MRGRGFTLVELMIVMAMISILMAIAVPQLLQARRAANEAAAVDSLRAIHSAQDAFRATCGRGDVYATTLPQLGAGETLSPNLARGVVVVKSGYSITLTAEAEAGAKDSCTGGPVSAHWYARAVPVSPGSSGMHGFATSDDNAIWQDVMGVAPELPFTPSKTVSQVR